MTDYEKGVRGTPEDQHKHGHLHMPTEEQLESRRKLKEFVEAASGMWHRATNTWFGRPNEELQGYIEQGRALDEVKDSRFYAILMYTLDRQIQVLQDELEVCPEAVMRDLRASLKAFRFIRSFILTTERNANVATGVLSGRGEAVAKDVAQFVKNVRIES